MVSTGKGRCSSGLQGNPPRSPAPPAAPPPPRSPAPHREGCSCSGSWACSPGAAPPSWGTEAGIPAAAASTEHGGFSRGPDASQEPSTHPRTEPERGSERGRTSNSSQKPCVAFPPASAALLSSCTRLSMLAALTLVALRGWQGGPGVHAWRVPWRPSQGSCQGPTPLPLPPRLGAARRPLPWGERPPLAPKTHMRGAIPA